MTQEEQTLIDHKVCGSLTGTFSLLLDELAEREGRDLFEKTRLCLYYHRGCRPARKVMLKALEIFKGEWDALVPEAPTDTTELWELPGRRPGIDS